MGQAGETNIVFEEYFVEKVRGRSPRCIETSMGQKSWKTISGYTVHRRIQLITDIIETMDLREFPCDVADLTIQILLVQPVTDVVMKSTVKLGEEICGQVHDHLVDLTCADLHMADYHVFEPAPYQWSITQVAGNFYGQGTKRSALTVHINMTRYAMSYFYNVVLLLVLLTISAGIAVWSIPVSHFSDDAAERGEYFDAGRVQFDISVILGVPHLIAPASSLQLLAACWLHKQHCTLFAAMLSHLHAHLLT